MEFLCGQRWNLEPSAFTKFPRGVYPLENFSAVKNKALGFPN